MTSIRSGQSVPAVRPLVVCSLLLSLLAHATPAHAVGRTWFGGTGSAGIATNWTPNGVPSINDVLHMETGGYTITFPANVPSSTGQYYAQGTVSINCTSPHTIASGLMIGFSNHDVDASLGGGTLSAGDLQLEGAGSRAFHQAFNVSNHSATFKLTDSLTAHSWGRDLLPTELGNASFRVLDGGIASIAGQVAAGRCSLVVDGSQSAFAFASKLTLTSPTVANDGFARSLTFDCAPASGSAVIAITRGGQLDVAGAIEVGASPGHAGTLSVGSTSAFLGSLVTARGPLLLGASSNAQNAGGSGLLRLDAGGQLLAQRQVHVGSPLGPGGIGRIAMSGGALLVAGDSLAFYGGGNSSLDFRGGTIRQNGGLFVWQDAEAPLLIPGGPVSSTLLLQNHSANPRLGRTSPADPALIVGAAGSGVLRLAGAGTSFGVVTGECVLADSAGGTAALTVDSSAVMNDGGCTSRIGRAGSGTLTVQHQGSFLAGVTHLGETPSGAGTIVASGPGSSVTITDSLDVGGVHGIAEGTGAITLDSSAVLTVQSGSGAPLTHLYPGTSSMWLGPQARFTTTGTVVNDGVITLAGGSLQTTSATGVLQIRAGGTVTGQGTLTGPISGLGGTLSPTGSGISVLDTLHASSLTVVGTTLHILTFGGYQGSGPLRCDVDAHGDFGLPGAFLARVLSVTGHYTQAASGTLRIGLHAGGGTVADVLADSTGVTLAGKLAIVPSVGFMPAPGDSFVVLTCAARTGTFDRVTYAGVDAAPYLRVVYMPNAVAIVFISGIADAGPPADTLPRALRFSGGGAPGRPALALELPYGADVRIRLFDVAGRDVATLHDGALAPGVHRFAITPGSVPGGVYFARARVAGGSGARELSARVTMIR